MSYITFYRMITKFENFGASPEFTTKIQTFMFENCTKLEIAKDTGEQSINNYLLFQKYSEMMEKELSSFLQKEKYNSEHFIEACQFARDENVPCSFLDYVLSSIEFEDFYYLMLDYKNMYTQEVNIEENQLQNKPQQQNKK